MFCRHVSVTFESILSSSIVYHICFPMQVSTVCIEAFLLLFLITIGFEYQTTDDLVEALLFIFIAINEILMLVVHR